MAVEASTGTLLSRACFGLRSVKRAVRVRLFASKAGTASSTWNSLRWISLCIVVQVMREDLHDKVSKNNSSLIRPSVVTILEGVAKEQAYRQTSTETDIDVGGLLWLAHATSHIVLPRSLTDLDGDLEDVLNGVLDDHQNIEDHKEGEEDVGCDEGIAAVDDENDEGDQR